jgi:DNA-directed RNA polymerase subunit RPC12/RpoP
LKNKTIKRYYCIDCGCEISDYRYLRCRSCNGKWLYTNNKLIIGKLDADYKNGISNIIVKCPDCQKILSDYRAKRCKVCSTKHAFKMGLLNNKGVNNYRWQGGLPNCMDCGKKLKNYGNKRCVSCENKRKHKLGILNCKGKNNHFYGKHRKPNFIKYRGIWMRSSWEVAYAKHLDKQGIKWQYEFKQFNLGEMTYTPDFYLPDSDTYVEVKGWWNKKERNKFKLFKSLYSYITIKLYRQNHLRRMGVLK